MAAGCVRRGSESRVGAWGAQLPSLHPAPRGVSNPTSLLCELQEASLQTKGWSGALCHLRGCLMAPGTSSGSGSTLWGLRPAATPLVTRESYHLGPWHASLVDYW